MDILLQKQEDSIKVNFTIGNISIKKEYGYPVSEDEIKQDIKDNLVKMFSEFNIDKIFNFKIKSKWES